MIYEPSKFDYDQAVVNRRKTVGGMIHHCGHSTFFWEKGKIATYGDVIACEICCRYYVKSRHMPWIIERRISQAHAAMGIHLEFPPHNNHLETDCFFEIPMRITE